MLGVASMCKKGKHLLKYKLGRGILYSEIMIQADQPTIFNSIRFTTAVSSKEDGNMKYGLTEDAAQNLERFIEKVQQPPGKVAVIYVNDPNGWDVIHEVTPMDATGALTPEARVHADAFITNVPNILMVLPTADCTPIVIYDPTTHAVALVHLGWQSTEADLAYKVVQRMCERYDSKPEDLQVYAGPSIRAESYIFDKPLKQADNPAWQPFLYKVDAGTAIDLIGFNRQRLLDAGVLAGRIEICPVNTATSNNYFSHYRAVRTGNSIDDGRFVTICVLQS